MTTTFFDDLVQEHGLDSIEVTFKRGKWSYEWTTEDGRSGYGRGDSFEDVALQIEFTFEEDDEGMKDMMTTFKPGDVVAGRDDPVRGMRYTVVEVDGDIIVCSLPNQNTFRLVASAMCLAVNRTTVCEFCEKTIDILVSAEERCDRSPDHKHHSRELLAYRQETTR